MLISRSLLRLNVHVYTIHLKTINRITVLRKKSTMTSRSMHSQDPLASIIRAEADKVCETVCGSDNGVRHRYGEIIKSNSDRRHYRGLQLDNKLKVLLISDPLTDRSAAALDVNVGYLSDPDELPGLAHFCEHMLFLGTQKYPEENAYAKFLSEHGGACNASTGTDHTNYHFDILPEHLAGALDIFAQFFIEPLFTASATERELNAVDSEHEKNRSSDAWRLGQLNKSTADPAHPYSKFGTGNRETLETIPKSSGIDVREELLKFHQKWYSANIMTFVVIGKESLDELERMVVPLFSAVVNKEVAAPAWPEHPFPDQLRRKRAYVVPIKDVRSLDMSFPTPDWREHYKSAPAGYLAHLLGHEGPGSLLSALRNKGWCNSLSAGPSTVASGFGFFSVDVDLTEEGLEHIEDIVKMTFQYIEMLKHEGPKEWIYKEKRELRKLDFHFKDLSEPRSVVRSCAHALQEFPVEEILCGYYLLGDYKPELIQEVLTHLKVENVRIAALSKTFADKCTMSEKWYGTKHFIEDIPETLIQDWKKCGTLKELHLPNKNEFIPERLELEPRELDKSPGGVIAPGIILDSPKMRLWYRQDSEFMLPKACVNFEFVSPYAYSEPMSCNANAIWVLLLKDSLVEYGYSAEMAGLNWFIMNTKHGLTMGIEGFDDKQQVFLEKMIDRIVNFRADPKRFEIMKDLHQRQLKNHVADQPYQHAIYYQTINLSHIAWDREVLAECVSDVTLEYLEEYARFMTKRIHIEGLIFGNMTKERALNMAAMIESKLPKDGVPLFSQHLLLNREIELGEGTSFLREVECSVHRSSCASTYYACGLQDTRSNVTLELLSLIMHEPCFDTLRTKEQLGYIVFSGLRRSVGVQGLRIIVQSPRSPEYLDSRIEAFLAQMRTILVDMSEEEFAKYKSSLAAQKLEKPKRLLSRFSRMWSEISTQQYNFDKHKVEAADLENVTKADLLAYYDEYIAYTSLKRQKLAVHVKSTATDADAANETASEAIEKVASAENLTPAPEMLVQPVKITDLIEFKSSRKLYQNLSPVMKVPRKGTHSKL